MSVKRRDNKVYAAGSDTINGINPDNPFLNGPSTRYSEAGATGLGVHESPVIPDYQPPETLRDPDPATTSRMSSNATNTAARMSGTTDVRRSRNTASNDYTYSGPYNARRVISDPVETTTAAPTQAAVSTTAEHHPRHHSRGHHSGHHGHSRRSSGQQAHQPQPPSLTTPDQQSTGLSKRSPLQKLEADPWHMYKDKDSKRARLEEAELALSSSQARSAKRVTNNGLDNLPKSSTAIHRRAVSVPEQQKTSGVSSTRAQGKQPAGREDDTSNYQRSAELESRDSAAQAAAVAAVTSERKSRVSRGPDYQYGSGNPPTQPQQAPVQQTHGSRISGRDAAVAGGVAALAAAGVATAYNGKQNSGTGPERRDSKKLQKKPPQDRRRNGNGSYYNYDNGNGNTYSSPAATNARTAELDSSTATKPSIYHTPPQRSSATPQKPDQRELGIQQPKYEESEHGFHLPHILRGRHRDEQRYVQNPTISDWRSIPTVSLLGEDLDLDPEVYDEPQRSAKSNMSAADRAWWEKRPSERRYSSEQEAQATPPKSQTSKRQAYNDASIDPRSGQSYFNPPIYLKCGPLLRLRGIYRETVRSSRSTSKRTRDIWRGSLMVVTNDRKVPGEPVPPVLRLFKQPVELLPPPPNEVDEKTQVSPEYLDPVAGQVKMSRVGKTLYVRPVEDLPHQSDLSRMENDKGLFQEKKTTPVKPNEETLLDGEAVGKVREAKAKKLFSERGATFWKWNIEIELGEEQARIAYRINRGPAVAFWVPARGENMNIMFHSCNGFSLSVQPNEFAGPDPLWRDVLNSHQTRPFHVMIGGGDQLYMDAATVQTKTLQDWAQHKNPHYKHHAPFTPEMQDELETFYLNRYSMWFSQGFFGMANGQIPMVNIWDDHDIMDGYGSYSDSTMRSPVMQGIGAVAYKYYMLFQHQSVPEETQVEEPSWLLGAEKGPYIPQRSRSLFMSLGRTVALLGVDCRTERRQDQVLCDESWDLIFKRLEEEVVKGQTKHLIVLLGIPIAYPRLNWLENILTSRAMYPVKEIGRTGLLGGFVNKFDGAIEILDDLDDHWTAKHHKDERNWFIQELQHLSAEKSVRITLLGGDVHLAAVGEFFSRRDLAIPKDRDHRYMVNVISSAIVNTPPGDRVANWIGTRNKIHHLDEDTDEDMIGLFKADTDGHKRNNPYLFPKRNWCSIREYRPENTPPASPDPSVHEDEHDYEEEDQQGGVRRSLSFTRRNFSLLGRGRAKSNIPPISYYNQGQATNQGRPRASSADNVQNPPSHQAQGSTGSLPPNAIGGGGRRSFSDQPRSGADEENPMARPNSFLRRPTDLSEHHVAYDPDRGGHIDFSGGLAVTINVENMRGEPEGTTTDYRLLIPALDYTGVIPAHVPHEGHHGIRKHIGGLLGGVFSRSRAGSMSHPAEQSPTRNGSVAQSSVAGPEPPAKRIGLFQRAIRRQDATEDDRLGGWTDQDAQEEPPTPAVLRKPIPVANTLRADEPSNARKMEAGVAAAAFGAGAVAASRKPTGIVRNKRTRDSYPPPSSASPKRQPTDLVSPIDNNAPTPPPKDEQSPVSPISNRVASMNSGKPGVSGVSGVSRSASGRHRFRGSQYDDEVEDAYIPIERRPSIKQDQIPAAANQPPTGSARNDYGYNQGAGSSTTAAQARQGQGQEEHHEDEEPLPKKQGWFSRLTRRNRYDDEYYTEEEESHWSDDESQADEHHHEEPAPTRGISVRSFFASGRSARVAPYEDERSPTREYATDKDRKRGSSWRFWRVAD